MESNSASIEIYEYSIWLLPEMTIQTCLDEQVRQLSSIFGTDPFPAHVTILGDIQGHSEEKLKRLLLKLASCPAIECGVQGACISEEYFRSFYLRLSDAPEFFLLKRLVAELSDSSQGVSPFPHISLGYGEPSDNEVKSRLLKDFHAFDDLAHIRLDRVALARSSKNIPISEWSIKQILFLS